jgi:hypothetical protein
VQLIESASTSYHRRLALLGPDGWWLPRLNRLLTLIVDCRSGRLVGQRGAADAAGTWFKDITGAECPDRSRLVAIANLIRVFIGRVL